ncbi:WxcM-like domain-containing protein [Erwinia persicina]|uniref:WxcM-like domain-containing protein n=1 Tax=Erwinia persicina TaxID=55211 RepID=UPI0034E2AB13
MSEEKSFFVHEKGLCESLTIGDNTRVWAFAHILQGAKIGSECNVCDNVFIENDVVIGNRVTLKCGVQVWDGITIEDDVFVGPNVTFTNDKFPRSKVYPDAFPRTLIRSGASLGANSTILPGITIGANAMVGAGAVVTRDVPDNAIVVGNPAKIVNYVNKAKEPSSPLKFETIEFGNKSVIGSSVIGVEIHSLNNKFEANCVSLSADIENIVPFSPKKINLKSGVVSPDLIEESACLHGYRFFVLLKGSVHVAVESGRASQMLIMETLNGLYLPPMIWCKFTDFSPDAILISFISENREDDLISSYAQYKKMCQ